MNRNPINKDHYGKVVGWPFPNCYACNGQGLTTVSQREKCVECDCDGYVREYCNKVIDCPICKGTGLKDRGQGQLF